MAAFVWIGAGRCKELPLMCPLKVASQGCQKKTLPHATLYLHKPLEWAFWGPLCVLHIARFYFSVFINAFVFFVLFFIYLHRDRLCRLFGPALPSPHVNGRICGLLVFCFSPTWLPLIRTAPYQVFGVSLEMSKGYLDGPKPTCVKDSEGPLHQP